MKSVMRCVITRTSVATSLVVVSLLSSAALADCVDYSAARAAKAGAALERNPPAAAQLGVPNLEGFKLNGAATTGDPKCEGPNPPKSYTYTTDLSVRDVLTAYYANIQPYIEEDGMKRKWFRNPYWSSGRFYLTSGTEISLNADASGKILSMRFAPAKPVKPLTTPTQPYSVEDMIAGTPWPGGPNGRREFVRADGPAAAAAPAGAGVSPASNTTSATASTKCAPKPDGTMSGEAGAAIGDRVLGGRLGRSVGGALGGILGKPKQQPATDPNCP